MLPCIEEDSASRKPLKKRKCEIADVILKNKKRVEPLFIEFANGRPLLGADLTATVHQNMSKDLRRQRRRVLTVATPKLTYGGTNFGHNTRQANSTTTFLGVLDKSTGKMRLIETSSYCLHPMIPCYSKLASKKKDNDKDTKALSSRSYLEMQEAVASAFGSKKAKQAVNRKKQFKVETNNMTVAIDQAVSGVTVEVNPDDIGKARKETLLTILPPCDREASCIEEVYRLQDLAPDSFLVHLEESANEHLEARYPDPSYPLLVIDLLSTSKLEPDEYERVKLCCLVLFIHHLLGFLSLKGRELCSSNALEDCPPKVKKYIYQEFTHGHTRMRSNQNEDRVLVLILVLAFIANNHRLPAGILLQSLPLARERLNMVMKVIGATYHASNQVFELKLPLVQLPRRLQMLGRRGKKQKGRL